jgi:hypothetical protein
LSNESGPQDRVSLRGMGGRILSDHGQLAAPDNNPNRHAVNESKAEIHRKCFFFGFASPCMIPLWQ